jgi:enterochelin esterase-like enzyme
VAELTDSVVRSALVRALMADGIDEDEATAAVDRWQGDHDYRAWQRGYQEAMIFGSNLLMDAADSAQRR